MAEPHGIDTQTPAPLPQRLWRRYIWGVSGALAVALAGGWLARMPLVDHLIAGQLAGMGLEGHYRISRLDTGALVLSDVVLGAPSHPDLVAARIEIAPHLLGRGLGAITLIAPRLIGKWQSYQGQGGRFSFGSLDKLIYGPSTGPFRLPDADLTLVDGRLGLAGAAGSLGLAVTGQGNLRDGFVARVAAVAPRVAGGGCGGSGRLDGQLAILAEQPHLTGDLTLGALACGAAQVAGGTARISATGTRGLDGAGVRADLASGPVTASGASISRLTGTITATARQGAAALVAWHLLGDGLRHDLATIRALTIDGTARLHGSFGLSADGSFAGQDLAASDKVLARLRKGAAPVAGTLAQPLIARFSAALAQQSAGNRLVGSWHLASGPQGMSLVLPQAVLTGGGGAPMLTASHVSANKGAGGILALSGNFVTSGAGVPQITARMQPDAGGGEALHLAMADYAAGDAHAAIPALTVRAVTGGYALAGGLVVSGKVPGGEVAELRVPVAARVVGGVASLWPQCAELGFERIASGTMVLDGGRLRLCPQGRAAVTVAGGGVTVAGYVPGFAMAGHVGAAPLRVAGQDLRLAMGGGEGRGSAGAVSARGLDVVMGSGGEASHYRIAALDGVLGGGPHGHVSGVAVALAPVPFDLGEGAGDWRWAGGVLSVDGLMLRVTDRQSEARFAPLTVRDGRLALAGGVISADALLREPKSDRAVVHVALAHDLGSAEGHADLGLDGLTFDAHLQPDTLTPMALGTIANASGTIRGTGLVHWRDGQVTSNGRFASDGFDFASAAGPVKGVAGEVVFTDLLGLVTAPRQTLRIASINPGIEVDDGALSFALQPGRVLAVAGAQWPFLDGELKLMPTRMVLGASEVRHFELAAQGIDAAKFLAHMEISNLAATGAFDGRLPLVFDQNGGRIEHGYLVSRKGGGSVSYVGALSYKDLSPIANYAFRSLRAMQYTRMRVDMDGDIAGELVTRVAMKGLSQGKGTSRNFITRQIAKLPLEFNVNLRAPFYQLITSFRSMYDTSLIADPRTLGLVSADGRAIAEPAQTLPDTKPTIQPPVSEHRP